MSIDPGWTQEKIRSDEKNAGVEGLSSVYDDAHPLDGWHDDGLREIYCDTIKRAPPITELIRAKSKAPVKGNVPPESAGATRPKFPIVPESLPTHSERQVISTVAHVKALVAGKQPKGRALLVFLFAKDPFHIAAKKYAEANRLDLNNPAHQKQLEDYLRHPRVTWDARRQSKPSVFDHTDVVRNVGWFVSRTAPVGTVNILARLMSLSPEHKEALKLAKSHELYFQDFGKDCRALRRLVSSRKLGARNSAYPRTERMRVSLLRSGRALGKKRS